MDTTTPIPSSTEPAPASVDLPKADPAAVEAGREFKPNSLAQAQFLVSRAPELLLTSAYGKGKSRVLCEKAHWMARAFPGSQLVLARKKRAHMGNTTLRTLLEEVIHPSERGGWRPAADGGSTLFLPNGSAILVVGLDNPGRARSGSFNAAFVDQAEELDEEEWEAISGRLRLRVGPYRQLAATCNPSHPGHFLFRRFKPARGSHVQRTQYDEPLVNGTTLRAGQIRRELVVSGPRDNYQNLPEDYIIRLSQMRGRYAERYVTGLWTSYEGLIYELYNDALHHVERPVEWADWYGYPPPDWKRARSIDFGYVNPFVLQWWARRPDDRAWFLYREIYRTRRLVSQHGQHARVLEQLELEALNRTLTARKLATLKRVSFRWCYADHDAEDRATLEKAPISILTRPANKDVTAGIQTVCEMLTAAPLPHVYLVRGARVEEADGELERQGFPTCTAEEFGYYRYAAPPDSSTPRAPREEPAKVHDHGMDAMRYLFHSVKSDGELTIDRVFSSKPAAADD
jgi:terminase large subunit-like protein